jgi:HSP20 family molecular chaperone IbpA
MAHQQRARRLVPDLRECRLLSQLVRDLEERMADKNRSSSAMEQRGSNLPQPYSSNGWLIGSPFDLVRRFSDEMQGFFGHAATWEPTVEVFQRGTELVVRADLPGLT